MHRRARGEPSPPTIPASDQRPNGNDSAHAPYDVNATSDADGSRPATTPPPQGVDTTALTATPDSPRTVQLTPDDPLANLAVRVRRPLDELVAWRLAELRRHGVRASKAELMEMLLWELAPAEIPSLAERLAAFRRAAPRSPR